MGRLKLSFRYDKRRGEVTEFVVDDGDRTAPEAYHEALARLITDELVPTALIRDAGDTVIAEPEPVREPAARRQRRQRREGGS
jgi:hypothetical protein